MSEETLLAAIAAAPHDAAGYAAYGEWLREQGVADLVAEPTIEIGERYFDFPGTVTITLPLTPALDRGAIARFLEHPSSRFLRNVRVVAFGDPKPLLRVLNHPRLALVRELTLSTTDHPAMLFEAVVRSPILAHLAVLDVSGTALVAASLDVVIPSASGFSHLEALEVGKEESPGLVERLRASVPSTSTKRYEAAAAAQATAMADASAALETALAALNVEMANASPEQRPALEAIRVLGEVARGIVARGAEPPLEPPRSRSDDELSLDDLLAEVAFAFRERGYTKRANDWWESRVDDHGAASDETLLSLAREFADFEREIELEYAAALAPFAEECRRVFEPLDDRARREMWKTERDTWTTTAVHLWRLRQVASPFDVVMSDAERAALAKRGRELRTRAMVVTVRGRDPYPRNAELEAAIAAAPDDVDNYLVYADWLQERGDPRGELIALQAKGAGSARVDPFVDAHAAELLGDLATDPALREVDWHLGFVRHAWVEPSVLARLADHPAAQLLRSLRISGPVREPAELFAVLGSDRLAHVRTLTLSAMRIAWDVLLASPILGRLTALEASDVFLDDAGAEAILAAAPRLGHLASLELSPVHIADVLARQLAASLAKVRWAAGVTGKGNLTSREVEDARALLEHARAESPEPILETRDWLDALEAVVARADAERADAERAAVPFFHPTAGQALADIELALGRRATDLDRER